MTSEIFPQSQSENPIDRIVDTQQRLEARQASVHALIAEHNLSNGHQSSYALDSQAISDRRREAHQDIANRELLVDPELAVAVSIGGIKQFFSRFRRSQQISSVSDNKPALASESLVIDFPTANSTVLFAEQQLEPKSDEYEFLSSLLSPESLKAKRLSITETIAASPDLVAYGLVYEAKLENSKSWAKANRTDDRAVIKRLDDEVRTLGDSETSFDTKTKTTYTTLREQINQIDKNVTITMESDEPEAEALLSLLEKTEQVERSDAPFKQFADNNHESWKVVNDDEIKSYLEEIPFVPSVSTDKGTVIINPSDDKPFEVPLSVLKHAQGFDSWKGRHTASKSWSSEYGVGSMSSLDVIKHYAGLTTELPPVSEIRVFVQPNGRIFCDNGSGDSHRIAAALLRGDSTIKADKLEFVRISYNLI